MVEHGMCLPGHLVASNAMQVSDTILRQISKLEDASCWACGAPGSRMQIFMLGKAPRSAARCPLGNLAFTQHLALLAAHQPFAS